MEEMQIKQRYSDLSVPAFEFLKEMLESDSVVDRKWAFEQLSKGFVKMIPQDLMSGGEKIKAIPFLDYVRSDNSNQEIKETNQED